MNYPTEVDPKTAGIPLGLQSSSEAPLAAAGIDSSVLSHDLGSNNPFATSASGASITNSGIPRSYNATSATTGTSFGSSTGATTGATGSDFSQQAAERAGNIAQTAQDTFTNVQQNATAAVKGTVAPKDAGSMNEGEAHVAGLAGGIGGAILTAPLAALEAISPTIAGHASNAASIAQGHAQNVAQSISARLPDLTDPNNTNSATVQEKAGQLGQAAQSYLGQAANTVKGYLPESAKGYLPDNLGGGATATGISGGSGGLTDTGRQDASDKVGAALKPDSQKTFTESAKDTLAGNADKAASYVQPEQNKSLGQQATDTFTS